MIAQMISSDWQSQISEKKKKKKKKKKIGGLNLGQMGQNWAQNSEPKLVFLSFSQVWLFH